MSHKDKSEILGGCGQELDYQSFFTETPKVQDEEIKTSAEAMLFWFDENDPKSVIKMYEYLDQRGFEFNAETEEYVFPDGSRLFIGQDLKVQAR